MITIHVGDVVAASLAAAGACLACSIPAQTVRKFPLWAYQTYGRGALLLPLLAVMVGTLLVSVAARRPDQQQRRARAGGGRRVPGARAGVGGAALLGQPQAQVLSAGRARAARANAPWGDGFPSPAHADHV